MFHGIQFARGFAAVAVAAFHLSVMFGDSRYAGEPVLLWITYKFDIGVDFFFVLSGFIIMSAHEVDINNKNSLIPYLIKRFIRLWPVYLIYTLTIVFFVYIGFGKNVKIPHDYEEWISAITLIKFGIGVTPISPAWTLYHEVCFYAIFAILIFNNIIGRLVIFLWVALLIYFFGYDDVHNRTPFGTYFSAFNINFILGMISYKLHKKVKIRHNKIILCASILILVGVYMYSPQNHFYTYERLIYACIFSIVIYSISNIKVDKNAFRGILAILGDASYSIYLLHESFQSLILKAVVFFDLMSYNKFLLYFAVLVISIGFGVLSYLTIERPTLSFLRSKFMMRDLNRPGFRGG